MVKGGDQMITTGSNPKELSGGKKMKKSAKAPMKKKMPMKKGSKGC